MSSLDIESFLDIVWAFTDSSRYSQNKRPERPYMKTDSSAEVLESELEKTSAYEIMDVDEEFVL